MSTKLIKYIAFILIGGFFACGKQTLEEPKESILVEIGDRTISVSEFMRRAEYTVRPVYCKGNNNLDKKIILNSLIAEKLISMEATDSSDILKAEKVKLYLQGLKEQAMRQWLYSKVATEKVELDSAKILKTVKVAGRKYKISYFNIPDSSVAYQTHDQITSEKKSFSKSFTELTGLDSIPYREVEWSIHEHNQILDSLYTEPLKKNQIVGPIKINKNEYILAKVNGWIDRPILIEKQFNDRLKDVADKYRSRDAVKLYEDYVKDLMKDKKIEFVPKTFYKMANILGPQYLVTDKEKKEMLNNSAWKIKDDEVNYAQIGDEIESLKGKPLFKVNDQIYTVADFIKEVKIRPLVFRKLKMKNIEFGQQLQFAIMDLIRDKFITEDAYERNYNKVNVVQRNYNMWKDNLNYIYNKEKYLFTVLPDSAENLDYLHVLEKYMNGYVDSLQHKYANLIKVDVEKFNSIDLSRIDMNVNYNNQPYKKVVPSFPIVTTDYKLDYGEKMNNSKN